MNPFQAIKYVGSGLALVAFVAAVIAVMYRSRLANRKALVESAPPEERARLLEGIFRDFSVVPLENLSNDQRYSLALKLIEDRRYRFRFTAVAGLVVGALLTVISFNPGWHSDTISRLTVHLKDASNPGDRIATGKVTVEAGTLSWTKAVDGDGLVEFEIPSKSYAKGVSVRPGVEGYASVPTVLHNAPAGGVCELSLTAESLRVTGTVLDDPEHRTPLAGVLVDFGSGLVSAVTDANGDFRVELPRPPGSRIAVRLTRNGRTGFDDSVTLAGELPPLYFDTDRRP